MNAKNIFGAVCVAIALFFIWPAVFGSWSEMQALKTAVKDREELLAKRNEILKEAAAQYAKYSDIKSSELAIVLSSFVPTKKNSAELISAASSIATTSGLQLKSVRVADETKSKKNTNAYGTMTMQLELAGQYAGLRMFLNDLESYVRILNVRTLSVNTDDQTGELRFEIAADTYYIE